MRKVLKELDGYTLNNPHLKNTKLQEIILAKIYKVYKFTRIKLSCKIPLKPSLSYRWNLHKWRKSIDNGVNETESYTAEFIQC